MTRLATIAAAQKRSRIRDAMFAVAVAVAAVISISTITTAAQAASLSH